MHSDRPEAKHPMTVDSAQAPAGIDVADKINFVELVAVFWRRRRLMAGVFLFILGLAVLYCFIATPNFLITAQISPGITGFDRNGRAISHWSAKDIQSWFLQKSYLEDVVKLLGADVEVPEIKAGSNRASNIVNISFDWPDPEEGKQIMQSTIDYLILRGDKSIQQLIGNRRTTKEKIYQLEKDKERILIERKRLKGEVQKANLKLAVDKETLEHEILKLEKQREQITIAKKRIDYEISKANNSIKVLATRYSSIKKNTELVKNAANRIKKRIEHVNKNTEDLMQLRNRVLSAKSDKLALLMYSNIIQQNISFATNLQQHIDDLEKENNRYIDDESETAREIEDIKIEIKDKELERDIELVNEEEEIKKNIRKLKSELVKIIKDTEIDIQELEITRNQELSMKNDELSEQIDTLETTFSSFNPLEVNQMPFSSNGPVNPPRKKILILAVIVAGFLAMLAAISREFWINNRDRVMGSSAKARNN